MVKKVASLYVLSDRLPVPILEQIIITVKKELVMGDDKNVY